MIRLALCAQLIAATTTQGTILEVRASAGQPAAIRLESAVDDAHLANPPAYHAAEPPVARVVQRIVIENVGRGTVRNPDVRLNGAPILPVADPVAALGLTGNPEPVAIFSAWTVRRIHGTTGLRINRDPLEVLRAFGATFCGDDSNALGVVAITRGAEVRFVWVTGHSVAEHRFPGRGWEVFDGDQNLFYPKWDNRTPASGADILADPLLALRVKLFGRNAGWNAPSAWQNTSRFEFIRSGRPQKVLRSKAPPAARDWELLPGERIEILPGVRPDAACAATEELRRDERLVGALCRVNFVPARSGKIALPYPATSQKGGDPVYEVEAVAGIPVACQAARSQFPPLGAGNNKLEVSGGTLRVAFETRPIDRAPVARPKVLGGGAFPGDTPHFEVRAGGADQIWWQIAEQRDFRTVIPNLERAGTFSPVVSLDAPIDATFLDPGREYFFHAKVRRGGVWSDWSEPVAFTVRKPPAPRIESLEWGPDRTALVRWSAAADGEMMVFGSDRIDFLPEVFAAREVVRLENGSIREERDARNLLAVVPGNQGRAVVPARAAYRLIARHEKLLSVPSSLVRLEGAKARVLQNRHEKAAGALVGRDVAVEMDVP